MKTYYTINKKDLKDAIHPVVNILPRFKVYRLIFTFILPLFLLPLLIWDPDFSLDILLFGMIFLSIFTYFFGYRKRLLILSKRVTKFNSKGLIKCELLIDEDKFTYKSSNITKDGEWKDIYTYEEFDDKIVLYLSPKYLNFIVVKKNSSNNQQYHDEFLKVLISKLR